MASNPNAIEKTLMIMKAFIEEPFEYTAKELSDKLSISKPTIHRILNLLEKEDFVKRTADNVRYTVGHKSYVIGMQYAKRQNTYTDIRRIVDEVSKKTGHQVGYAVLEEEKVIGIYESETYNKTINFLPGEIYTVNCGVYGKVLMTYAHTMEELEKLVYEIELEPITPKAFTDPDELLAEYKKIREMGYSESYGEYIEGTIGIGAPTFSSDGRVHGCIGLSGIGTETFIKNKPQYIEEVLKGAAEISRLLR